MTIKRIFVLITFILAIQAANLRHKISEDSDNDVSTISTTNVNNSTENTLESEDLGSSPTIESIINQLQSSLEMYTSSTNYTLSLKSGALYNTFQSIASQFIPYLSGSGYTTYQPISAPSITGNVATTSGDMLTIPSGDIQMA